MSARKYALLCLAALPLTFAVCVNGTAAATTTDTAFQRSADSRNFAVILAGAGAEPEYWQRFANHGLTLRDILIQQYGYREEEVFALIGRGDEAPWQACTREHLSLLMADLLGKVRPRDQIAIFLFGHGTAGRAAKFNLVGPDITGAEMAELLAPFEAQRLVVVNTTSASQPFQEALRAEGRVLLSATRSGVEKYDTTFPRYLLEGLDGHAADRDKNGNISLWELFLFAKERVARAYEEAGHLPTEHPALDDNGDGHFSVSPDPMTDDGRLAQLAFIDNEEFAGALRTPEQVALHLRARELERRVIALRARKAELIREEYYDALEALLVDLARTTRDMRGADE